MAHAAENMYFLNGVDMFTAYGYVVASGSDELMRPPSMDDPFFHKFSDRNGTQFDLTAPTFTHQEATLKGHILATTSGDFWQKYEALFGNNGALRTPGSKKLTVSQLDRIFEVFYREVPNIVRYTRLKDNPNNKIVVNLDIRFEVLNSYPITGVNNFYAGGATSYPDTWAEIAALQSQPEYFGNEYDMNTGTMAKLFTIAIPSYKMIKRVTDLSASNANLTALFTLKYTVNSPTGVPFRVYGFEQSMPYSVNHVYHIELI